MLTSAGFVSSVRSQFFDEPRGSSGREVRELREQFTRRALDAGRVLADQYAKALAGVETMAAETGDYETALAAQRRRQAMADNYLNRDFDSSNSIVLKPADGKITGAVSFEKSENTLAFQRTSGSSAIWDIKNVPGNYTVNIICGVGWVDELPAGGKPGNEMEFGEVTSLTGADTSRLGLTLDYTGGWNEYKIFTIGEIKLSRSNARVAIKSTAPHGAGSLMRLKEIRLTPAPPSANPPDKEVMAAALTELEEIRRTHQSRIKEVEQPLLKAYLAKLTALGDQLISANHDEDSAEAVMAESRRVYASIGRSNKFTHTPPGRLSTAGLQEVHGVKFVEAPTNRGDRFLVAVGGEKFSVKLMSVSCPSPDPEDQSLNEFHERYFGIAKVDSATIGRQAKDFTVAVLRDRPLKIFTRWQKDQTGSVLAAVLSAEIGDFGGILVDNGLAAVLEPTSKNPGQRKIEAGIQDVLKHREAVAKARPVPPGAWAFAGETKPAP